MSGNGKSARLRVVIRGAVQGVGFRPFVYRIATEMRLTGQVQTTHKALISLSAQRNMKIPPIDDFMPSQTPVRIAVLSWNGVGIQGSMLKGRYEALKAAVDGIQGGFMVANKGLGGFHLVTDARSEAAVQLLRKRKSREENPFALMLPSLEMARVYCEIDDTEKGLLLSPESPIVLLRKKEDAPADLASSLAPGSPSLGIMLPYTPLHHILMRELKFPIVATSSETRRDPVLAK